MNLERFFKLRQVPPVMSRFLAGGCCLLIIVLFWAILTDGKPEDRIVSPAVMGSPGETLHSFRSLWFERALARNIMVSLWRVIQGFGLAAMIGVPLGIICGAWPWVNAFFAPVTIFGRNVPMSAMVPLTLIWFGIDETQKIMFIFICCVAFVIFDAALAITNVNEQFLQTALTLGANKEQVLLKVLVPIAMPEIFGSLRMLFGLAFGYIILAEMVNMSGGLGDLILTSQRQGPRDHVYLILVSISLVAYGLDRFLVYAERRIFPYKEQGT